MILLGVLSLFLIKTASSLSGGFISISVENVECYNDGNTDPKGYNYRGFKNTTKTGLACQKWTSQSPNGHSRTPSNYRYMGLGDHNKCRNPDGEPGGPWCYNAEGTKPRWQYCGVPQCSMIKACIDRESDPLGQKYRGYQAQTKDGHACQPWTSKGFTQKEYPDSGLGDGPGLGFCRNPNKRPGGPWCFYKQGDKLEWQYCGTPSCDKHKVNGGWSKWPRYWPHSCCGYPGSPWSVKRRYCNNPTPLYGGNDCSGSSTKQIRCDECVCDKC